MRLQLLFKSQKTSAALWSLASSFLIQKISVQTAPSCGHFWKLHFGDQVCQTWLAGTWGLHARLRRCALLQRCQCTCPFGNRYKSLTINPYNMLYSTNNLMYVLYWCEENWAFSLGCGWPDEVFLTYGWFCWQLTVWRFDQFVRWHCV